ncbi:hypothetical protein BDFG_01550 [Blastomyces dermatitidis ATCC 26199]|nr:hypothetical protein BDFG_01550 [Blastomyces dermatitidis ATCC 26199]
MEYHYISVIRDPASPDIPDGWILKSPDAEFWRVRRTVNVQLPAVWESQGNRTVLERLLGMGRRKARRKSSGKIRIKHEIVVTSYNKVKSPAWMRRSPLGTSSVELCVSESGWLRIAVAEAAEDEGEFRREIYPMFRKRLQGESSFGYKGTAIGGCSFSLS